MEIPDKFGPDKLHVMFGDLHLEKQTLIVIGQFFEGSGWLEYLVEAEITTADVADSFNKASRIKKTRAAHEVLVSVLFLLKREAFASRNSDELDFASWDKEMKEISVMYFYWDLVMTLQMTLLQLLRSLL